MSRKRKLVPSCSDYPLARSVRVEGDVLKLRLRDGRKFDVPLRWFSILRLAPSAAVRNVKVDYGVGVRWPHLGFELGVGGLVRECQRRRACKVKR